MRRLIASLVTAIMLFTCLPIGISAFAQASQRLWLSDSYISFSINSSNGRFAAKTTGGDPIKPNDEDIPILYEEDIPETSFTSFRIDGDEVIFGNPYLNAFFVQSPRVEGNVCTSIWKYKDVEITQRIELIENNPDLSVGNARVSYAIRNSSSREVKVGTRILFDISTGGNDGAFLMRAGEPFFIKGEREFRGDNIPLYWTAVDNLDNPNSATYGILYGWGEMKPSRLIFGHWAGLSSTKWDYLPDPWVDYSVEDNRMGTADSSVAIYWDDMSILSGERKVFSTLIGMGDIASKEITEDNLGISITAPKKVVLSEAGITSFGLTAEIDNTYPGSIEQSDLKVEISYPAICKLNPSQNQSITVPQLEKGSKLPIQWSFTPEKLESVNVFEFVILVTKDNLELKRESAYIVAMPNFNVALPEIEYNIVTPNKLYVGEMARKVSVMGNNFNYLRDNPDNWNVYVMAEDGTTTNVGKVDVDVISNNEIQVFIPEGLPLGTYGIGIAHQLAGNGFYREDAFSLTEDVRLATRAYGTLIITKTQKSVFDGTTNEEYIHTDNYIHHFVGNSPIVIPTGETEIARITGNIQKIKDGQYSIIPSMQNAIYLGKILKLIGEPDPITKARAEITVDTIEVDIKDRADFSISTQNQVVIKGNNQCRIYLEVPELRLGGNSIPTAGSKPMIWSKAFNLNVNDFRIKRPNLLGLSGENTANIAGFLLGIKELRVVYLEQEKQYAVEIKAGLDLGSLFSFLFKHLSTKSDMKHLTFVDVQVENFRIYEDGTVKYKGEFAVGLPQLKIGPLVSPYTTISSFSGKRYQYL